VPDIRDVTSGCNFGGSLAARTLFVQWDTMPSL